MQPDKRHDQAVLWPLRASVVTSLGLILPERAQKATDRRSLPMLLFLCILSSLMCFPGCCLLSTTHQHKGQQVPIFWYSTEEEENLGYTIACCFAGLQVVMFKGRSTSNCLALPEPSCLYNTRCLGHLHPIPERVHKVKLNQLLLTTLPWQSLACSCCKQQS